jgi:hypothetical protein
MIYTVKGPLVRPTEETLIVRDEDRDEEQAQGGEDDGEHEKGEDDGFEEDVRARSKKMLGGEAKPARTAAPGNKSSMLSVLAAQTKRQR